MMTNQSIKPDSLDHQGNVAEATPGDTETSYDLIRELCAWSDTPAKAIKDPWAHIAVGEDLMEEAQVMLAKLALATTPQPIETAPKDGTAILVEGYDAGDNFGWRQSRWTPAGYWAWTADAKRWLPLPEAPK